MRRAPSLIVSVHALAMALFLVCAVGAVSTSQDGAGGGHGSHSGHGGHGNHGSQGGTSPGAGAVDSTPKDPLRDAKVAPDIRRAAIASGAKASGRDELHELLAAIEACGACPAAKDLASMLAEWDPATLATPEIMKELIAIAASDKPEPVRVAAARAINAVPEAKRPDDAKPFAAKHVVIVCVPGQMKWDPKEISVPAGVVLDIEMRNDDSMQHNLLVVAPGSLSEIGVAADRFGESAEGKAREYVPDSPKVLHVMGMVEPGKTGHLWLIAPSKPATYPLVCTYPGHWRMMNGKMKVTKPATEPAAK